MTVVADCFLDSQRKAVASCIAGGSEDPIASEFLGVKRSWDETACRMYAGSMPHLERLIKGLDIDPSCLTVFDKKRFGVVFQVMQQRCAVAGARCKKPFEPFYLPAKILAQQTASNIVHALQTSLPELSASRLQELAKNVYE